MLRMSSTQASRLDHNTRYASLWNSVIRNEQKGSLLQWLSLRRSGNPVIGCMRSPSNSHATEPGLNKCDAPVPCSQVH
eukprot:12898253-Prorocentrum_lima.AAC.1